MKKSNEFFVYSGMVAVAIALICGNAKSVGSSGIIAMFTSHFEVCIILIPIAIGLALYGAYRYRKEKNQNP